MSSLAPAQSKQALPCELNLRWDCPITNMAAVYKSFLKNHALPLRLLVENEIFRLSVWTNPSNDFKRGTDHMSTLEKTMLDVGGLYPVPTIKLTSPSLPGSVQSERSGTLTQP